MSINKSIIKQPTKIDINMRQKPPNQWVNSTCFAGELPFLLGVREAKLPYPR